MNTTKIIQALTYMASKQPNGVIDTMKAYKLLWLADRYHLRHYTRTVTGDDYYALPYGPVPSDAKNLVDGHPTIKATEAGMFGNYMEVIPSHQLRAKRQADLDVFSQTDIDAMDIILANYGNKSAVELSRLSHSFPEWKQYETQLSDATKKNGYKIDKDLFYVNMPDSTGLFVDDPEKLEFLKEMFHQYQES